MFEILIILAAGAQDPLHDLLGSLAEGIEMHDRFGHATMIQTAVIDGDLQAARHWAGQLGLMGPDDAQSGELPTRFAELAQDVAEARSLADAAVATAGLGNACGDCHEQNEVSGSHFEPPPLPTVGAPRRAQMMLHLWGADRLWEGLIGRVEDSWERGANALTSSRFDASNLDRRNRRRAQAMADAVQLLGEDASEVASWDARTEVYGRLLTTCAECHSAFRGD